MLRALNRAELKHVTGGLCSYDTDSVPYGGGGGGGGGDQPPSNPPGGDGGDTGDDYAYSAFFDDEMDAVDGDAIEFTYYVPVEETQSAGGGGGGGGGGRGYDSTDYNGPEAAYSDYFASQHGPESIDVRAAISAGAFSNFAQHQDQIRTDLTSIVQHAPDAATANQRIDAYLTSAGLGGQVSARISDTGFAAVQQSAQGNSDDIIVNGYAYRVGTPNTIASFGSQGQFMLASYMPSDSGPAQVYGSLDGIPASKRYKSQYSLPKHMTEVQKAAVIYNETSGIVDPTMRQLIAALMAQVIENNDGRRFLAARPLAFVSGSQQQAAWNAAVNAVQQYGNIIASHYDMTNPATGATSWQMFKDQGPHEWRGLPSLGESERFDAAGTAYHYIDFYRDPAYAH